MKGAKALKKIISFIMITLLLCGCAKQTSKVKPVTSGISFTARITWYNEVFVCTGEISNQTKATFEINEPEDIKELKITCDGDNVTASFKGLQEEYDISKTPFSFICAEVYGALRDTWREDIEVAEKEQQLYIEGRANEKDYKMIIAPTGLPLSLEIPNESFTVIFEDVKIINE